MEIFYVGDIIRYRSRDEGAQVPWIQDHLQIVEITDELIITRCVWSHTANVHLDQEIQIYIQDWDELVLLERASLSNYKREKTNLRYAKV